MSQTSRDCIINFFQLKQAKSLVIMAHKSPFEQCYNDNIKRMDNRKYQRVFYHVEIKQPKNSLNSLLKRWKGSEGERVTSEPDIYKCRKRCLDIDIYTIRFLIS